MCYVSEQEKCDKPRNKQSTKKYIYVYVCMYMSKLPASACELLCDKSSVPLINLPAGVITSSRVLSLYNERKRLLEGGDSKVFFRRPPPATTRDVVNPTLKRPSHPTRPNKQAKRRRTGGRDSNAMAIAAIDRSKAARLQPVKHGQSVDRFFSISIMCKNCPHYWH